MTTPTNNLIEEVVEKVIEGAKYVNGEDQFEGGERFAYQQGFQDALAMVYIELTGTPKTKGKLDTLLTKHEDAVLERRDALFQETNVKKLLEQMEEDLLEYGQYHDPECLQMSEWADSDSECDCETIKAMRSFSTQWVGKTNELWVTHLKEHRKHCSALGNKDLTNRKRKVLGSQSTTDHLRANKSDHEQTN